MARLPKRLQRALTDNQRTWYETPSTKAGRASTIRGVADTPITELEGVSKHSLGKAQKLNLHTVGDLVRHDVEFYLRHRFGTGGVQKFNRAMRPLGFEIPGSEAYDI